MNKAGVALVVLVIWMPPCGVRALVVTEIMYDPAGADTGHEWIELYNETASPISLAGFKLFDGKSNHKLSVAAGTSTLASGAYAIIARDSTAFANDYPACAGTLFRSAFSLTNETGTLALRDSKGVDVALASYSSANGASSDGNSLNRTNDSASFAPHTPTPGSAMSESVIPRKPATVAPHASKTAAKKTPKVAKKKTVAVAGAAVAIAHVDDATEEESATTTEAAGVSRSETPTALPSSPKDPMVWYGLLGGVAVCAAAGILLFKHLARSEWTVLEETEKDM